MNRAKKIILNILKIWTISFLLSTAFVMTLTFIVAFLSPDMSVIVHINNYGEAIPELLLLLSSWVVSGIYAIVKLK